MKQLCDFIKTFLQYSRYHSPAYAWKIARQTTYEGFPF